MAWQTGKSQKDRQGKGRQKVCMPQGNTAEHDLGGKVSGLEVAEMNIDMKIMVIQALTSHKHRVRQR
jgi:hypothetical protein